MRFIDLINGKCRVNSSMIIHYRLGMFFFFFSFPSITE